MIKHIDINIQRGSYVIVAKGNEKITRLMNDWYKAMRSQKLLQAKI